MGPATEVREYWKSKYVDPARTKAYKYILILSCDVHKDLNYRSRYALVCSAMGSNLFEEMASVRKVSIEGPLNCASTVFACELI